MVTENKLGLMWAVGKPTNSKNK